MKQNAPLLILVVWCLTGWFLPVQADILIKEWNTPKKIHILFVPDPSTDLVSVNFSFQQIGSAVDPKGKEGLAAVMMQLLFERTVEGSDRFTLQKKLKRLGVIHGIQYDISHDNINFWFKCPKDKLKEAFLIVKIILTEPSLDEKELAKMKNYDPAGSRLATAGELEFAKKILFQKVFSPHPYALPTSGTLEGRQSITIQDIQQSIQQRFVREKLVFSVTGNIDQNVLGKQIDETFGGLPEKSPLPNIGPAPLNFDGQMTILHKDSPQSGVEFGQPGVAYNHPDYLPLLVINDILGGKPFTSRIWLEAREKQGLVYNIQTDLSGNQYAALLTGSFECDNQNAQTVITIIKNEWKSLKENGVNEKEFKAAKTGLMGRFVLNFTSPDGIAQYLLMCYLNGFPTNYINLRNKLLNEVTLEQVNRVAKEYLNLNQLTFVIVGNPSQ